VAAAAIFFVGVAGFCVFAGVPIAFGFGLATFGYLALTTHTPLMVLVGRMDEGMSHLILLSVPLFVFLGLLIEMTGMARAMVAFLASLLGHVRGGLHYVLVGAMYLVSGISGAKAADMAAVAPVLFPEMKARGARPGDLVALLAATGAQTETIPPSLVLITIGSVTGVSIAALFTGGLLPGVVLAITLSALVWWRYRGEDLRHVKRASGSEIMRAFAIALPAIALPFVIRYAVVEGIATATEVSTIGIVYAFIVGFLIYGLLIYRSFDWRRLVPMLIETASLSGAILLIIGWHGLGPDPVRLLARAGCHHDRATRRLRVVHRGIDRRVYDPGQRARGHSGDRAVRPAAVSDRAHRRRPRGALCHDRHPRHGHRTVRPAVRSRLLCGLRHRARRSRRGDQADLGLSAGAAGRVDYRGDIPVDIDRVPVSVNGGGR
jgi:Tripartite ATP-independent periplasmic transporter, DctM component